MQPLVDPEPYSVSFRLKGRYTADLLNVHVEGDLTDDRSILSARLGSTQGGRNYMVFTTDDRGLLNVPAFAIG